MLLPLHDTPNFSTRIPWVNYALIAANVLVFVITRMFMGGDAGFETALREWGFTPATARIETLFTSIFLHAGFMHLAGNMLFLWIFGDNVEGRLGHVGYLATYLGCGLAATGLYYLLDMDGVLPCVGASGAIFGIAGFYFWAFPKNKVRILIYAGFVFAPLIPARWVLGIYFALDLFMMVLRESQETGAASGGTAYAAHVGGFLFGLLVSVIAMRLLPPLAGPRPKRGLRHLRTRGRD
jgi:membrane associated rhomboid family serine protease